MSKIGSRIELVDDLPILYCGQKSAAPDAWALPVVGCGEALRAALTSVIDGAGSNIRSQSDVWMRNSTSHPPLRESRSYINLVACQP